MKQYVFSRTLDQLDPEVEIVSSDPVEFVSELKRQDGMDIWLCGDASLAGQLVVKRAPIVLGSGIPLFRAPFSPAHFTADRHPA